MVAKSKTEQEIKLVGNRMTWRFLDCLDDGNLMVTPEVTNNGEIR